MSMATRFPSVAQAVRRRHAVAAERRRLLTHALHSDLHRSANDTAPDGDDLGAVAEWGEQTSWADVTAPYIPTRARGTLAPPIAARVEPPAVKPATAALPLSEQIERLRVQAAACRAQAITLNAKLVLLEADRAELPAQRSELHAVREQLIHGSARLDHAIEELDAVNVLEQQLAAFE